MLTPRQMQRLDTIRADAAFIKAKRDDPEFLRGADIVRFRYAMDGIVLLADMLVELSKLFSPLLDESDRA